MLGNTKVGEGAVITPGSVVTKEVGAFLRVGGVPARLILNMTKFIVDESDTIFKG